MVCETILSCNNKQQQCAPPSRKESGSLQCLVYLSSVFRRLGVLIFSDFLLMIFSSWDHTTVPHRLMCLNVWSLAGGTVLGGLASELFV